MITLEILEQEWGKDKIKTNVESVDTVTQINKILSKLKEKWTQTNGNKHLDDQGRENLYYSVELDKDWDKPVFHSYSKNRLSFQSNEQSELSIEDNWKIYTLKYDILKDYKRKDPNDHSKWFDFSENWIEDKHITNFLEIKTYSEKNWYYEAVTKTIWWDNFTNSLEYKTFINTLNKKLGIK